MTTVWPDLDDSRLLPTLATLHLWTQVVGKVRLKLTPWENHGWHVPFYLSPRGLITGLIPLPGNAFTFEFDLLAAQLVLRIATGEEHRIPLTGGSLSGFYERVVRVLRLCGIDVAIDPMPNELVNARRFDEDHEERAFEPTVAVRYWRAMLEAHRIFQLFRTSFHGKVSPVHVFWGAFDLAVTRFSGRDAPRHPGGAPHLDDAVAREAYSHEVSSAGFWPNLEGEGGPCFYSYAYPQPAGFSDVSVEPAEARFDVKLGEFILPYAAVRTSSDPDAALLSFLHSTYATAADFGGWDRTSLEREQGRLGFPPSGS